MVKNEILANASILSFLGRKMIKLSGLSTDLGYFGLNGDLLGLRLIKMSKHTLF